MGIRLTEAPLERRMGGFWCTALFPVLKEIAKEKGWREAIETCISGIRKNFVQEARAIIKDRKINNKDITSTKHIFEGFTDLPVPGWKFKEIEVGAEKAIFHQIGTCLMWETIKEMQIKEKLPLYAICQAGCTGAVQVVNPNLIVSVEKGLCQDAEYCEFIVEVFTDIQDLIDEGFHE